MKCRIASRDNHIMALHVSTTRADDYGSLQSSSLHSRTWTHKPPTLGVADTQYLLETLSAALMEAHLSDNPLEHDVVHKHCSPDFRMFSENVHECSFPQTRNLHEHLANIKDLKEANPQWKKDCQNYSATIQEGADHAIVWFTTMGTGGPVGCSTKRESISRLWWRRRETDGVWETYQQRCIRGPGNLFAQS